VLGCRPVLVDSPGQSRSTYRTFLCLSLRFSCYPYRLAASLLALFQVIQRPLPIHYHRLTYHNPYCDSDIVAPSPNHILTMTRTLLLIFGDISCHCQPNLGYWRLPWTPIHFTHSIPLLFVSQLASGLARPTSRHCWSRPLWI
jgi:hypothetical protein